MEVATETGHGAAGLRGWPLSFARAAWLAAAVLPVGLFAAGTYAYWVDLQEVCVRGAGHCSDRGLLTAEYAREPGGAR